MHNWKQLFQIDFDEKSPLYFQILTRVKKLVQNGVLLPGEALPSEQEMGEYFNVSRLTMRRAVGDLVEEGWLVRKKGTGTFVAEPNVRTVIPRTLGFSSKMRAMGLNPESRVLKVMRGMAVDEAAIYLRIEIGAPIVEISRVRFVDHEPVMLETTILSEERFPEVINAHLENKSLYAYLLEQYNVSVKSIDQTFRPIMLSSEQCALLNVAPNSLALESSVVAFDENNKVIEFSRSITREDKCQFLFHFRETATQE